MSSKNRVIIFCSLLDIWENVLLDILENVEWPRFLAHPVSSSNDRMNEHTEEQILYNVSD